jgi:hypothetical protein
MPSFYVLEHSGTSRRPRILTHAPTKRGPYRFISVFQAEPDMRVAFFSRLIATHCRDTAAAVAPYPSTFTVIDEVDLTLLLATKPEQPAPVNS